MLPVLRPYQEHDLAQVRYNFRTYRSVVLVEPTGAGKGTLASYIVNSASTSGYRVIFLVNRRDLVNNMADRVTDLGIPHGVIMGNDPRRRPDLNVHVASIDTLQRREDRPRANLLIVDEAHFAVSPIWLKVLNAYPEAKVLGLTATPIRLDGRGLGEVFESMVKGPSVQSLIDQAYLVPSVVFRPAGPELSSVRKTAGGDFNQKQLAEISDKPKLVGDLVEQWRKKCPDRKTVAFCVDKKHALHTAEQFRCAGFDWAYVDCDTPDEERKRIWKDFDRGQLNGVSSVGVISYGWDHPICSCIVGARATASMGLWRQMLGRASRPYKDKENFFVMDHFDNTLRLDALFEDDVDWTLDGVGTGKESEPSVATITTCRQCFASFRTGPLNCPYCGASLPRKVRTFETVNGDLVQGTPRKARSAKEWQQSLTGDQRRQKFDEFRTIAALRQYKPTWALVKYKAIFGDWPPRDWTRNA